jgi:ADP-ribosylglycohydrolase
VKVPDSLLSTQTLEFGLEWHHLPIVDVNTPKDDFEDLWVYSGQRLRNLLANGEKIVIHCLGGIGRTGTIAARLLTEFGDSPEEAIRKIRKVRPGSVETLSQEQYVAACKPVVDAKLIGSRREKALACLLGGAVGDAFGYEVEFLSITSIRNRFGQNGIEAPVPHHGNLIVSDDSQMTLFTLEGLIESFKHGENWQKTCTESIRLAYLDWYRTQRNYGGLTTKTEGSWLARQSVMQVQRAPGNTCMSALSGGGKGSLSKAINDSKGCGGVMRTAPLGLVGDKATTEEVFRLAAEAAALTHSHPSGYLSAGMISAVIHLLMEGMTVVETVNRSSTILKSYPDHEETLGDVEQAMKLAAQGQIDHIEAIEEIGGGWVGEEALAIGLYAVLSAKSFVEAIAIATNHSGDSDSTASIAGQIWGAAYGLEGMPHDWIVGLDVLVPLLHLSRSFEGALASM